MHFYRPQIHMRLLPKSIALLTAAIIAITPAFADYTEYYKEASSENLSTGTVMETQQILTDKGWINIKVLRVSLADPYTSLKVLYPTDSISKRKTLSSLTASQKNIIGAVNADFFDTKASTTLGPIIDDSKGYITSGLNDGKFASFNLTKDNQAYIKQWLVSGISIMKGEQKIAVTYRNKPYLNYDRTILYDRSWGAKSYGNTVIGAPGTNINRITEVVVADGVVTNVLVNQPPVDIPQNGYVLSCVGTKSDEAVKTFVVGDALTTAVQPDLDQLKLSVGGGSVLVKNGAIQSKMSVPITGRHPRTALGINADSSQVFLVTIDGRTNSYAGVTESELAKIMVDLGAANAINFDGGGSTEMMAKTPLSGKLSIVNTPSDGTERRIFTGVGITSSAPKSDLSSLRILSDDKIGIKDGSRMLSVKALDSNFNSMDVDQSKIKWTVTGVKASITGNRIQFKSAGKASITASYSGLSATLEMPVQESLYEMVITPGKIQTGFNRKIGLSVKGVTKDGYDVVLHPADIQWSLSKPLGSFDKDGNFFSGSAPGEALLKARFDGLEKYVVATIGETRTPLTSFENDLSTAYATPEELTTMAAYTLVPEGVNNSTGGKLSYDFTLTDKPRTAAVAFAGGGLAINGYPEKLGVWVNGTGGGNHRLRARFMDSRGAYFNVDLAGNVDWEGWKYTECTLPTNMKAPLKLSKIFLAEDNPVLQDTGSIILDDITTVSYAKSSTVVPKGTNKFADLTKMRHGANAGKGLLFVNPNGYDAANMAAQLPLANSVSTLMWNFDPAKFPALTTLSAPNAYRENTAALENTTLMNITNYGGYIRKNNPSQWTRLLTLKDRITTKNLVISTSSPLDFNDVLEKNLFFKTLEELRAAGKVENIVIVSPDSVNKLTRYRGADLLSVAETRYDKAKNSPINYITIKAESGGLTYQIGTMAYKAK